MSEFRKVCTKARKSPKCTYHVIIVSGTFICNARSLGRLLHTLSLTHACTAIIEYFVNKDQRIAVKLFEFGLPKYKHEPAYVSAYIKFLWNLNDEKNTRVLFERVLSLLGADETRSDSASTLQTMLARARSLSLSILVHNHKTNRIVVLSLSLIVTSEVWDLYLDFEHLCGNLGSISKLEKRRSTANNDYDPTGIFSLVSRYRYEDLWPCSAAELQSFGRPGGEEESATFTAAAIAALQSAKSRAGRGKHKSKGHAKGAAATAASSSAATATAASRPIDAREAAFSRFARPDIANHLIAYRPEMGLSLTPLGVRPSHVVTATAQQQQQQIALATIVHSTTHRPSDCLCACRSGAAATQDARAAIAAHSTDARCNASVALPAYSRHADDLPEYAAASQRVGRAAR